MQPIIINTRLFLLLSVPLVLGIFIGHFSAYSYSSYQTQCLITSGRFAVKNSTKLISHQLTNVQIVNLSEPVNGKFNCIKTKTLLNYFSTTVCLHELSKDIYVSGAFRDPSSIWEEGTVTRTLQLLLRNPHLDFIDIGANIGTYTMYASALGRFVLAVDCFEPNLKRIQRAAQLMNVTNRLVLVQNALFTKSGETLRLSNNAVNIGGQDVQISNTNNQTAKDDPYLVRTILFDELIPILKARSVRGVIMKVDIEGSESFVLEGGKQMFDEFDIPYIQMEWLIVRHKPQHVKTILEFFASRDYEPWTFACQLLNPAQNETWPNDFSWVKKNFTNVC